MKIEVVSACFYRTEYPARLLVETCRDNGFSLRLFGVGERFQTWYEAKIERLLAELNKTSSEVIVYMDASDTWFTGGAAATIERAAEKETADRTVLVAGEKNCYPLSREDAGYIGKAETEYPCPNAGMFLGATRDIMGLLELFRDQRKRAPFCEDDPRPVIDHIDNDQMYWCFCAARNGCVVDTRAEVFQTTDSEVFGETLVAAPDYGVCNTKTRQLPVAIHLNGGGKEDRLQLARMAGLIREGL